MLTWRERAARQLAPAAAHLLGQRLSKIGVQELERLVARGGVQLAKLGQQEAGVDQQALLGRGVALAHLWAAAEGGPRRSVGRAWEGPREHKLAPGLACLMPHATQPLSKLATRPSCQIAGFACTAVVGGGLAHLGACQAGHDLLQAGEGGAAQLGAESIVDLHEQAGTGRTFGDGADTAQKAAPSCKAWVQVSWQGMHEEGKKRAELAP